ncbi:hypothetical protein Rsub_08243 [Raphidocelis subcapitata]|uniref:Complex I-B14.7 n=1 Tax=Raphidocelis subcapitata TaxID=307507 RepID=A0A2V0PF38_9CHLO|nr:hypothetical protein Rsub_08243 [Raphidocelis subcapitata]|eukprot:GBF95807.1 hypothetical protein Rsub_08243 [Raphidocelis subcapitata]
MAPTDMGCVKASATLGVGMGLVSVPVGFFRAHADLKHLTIQEKLVRMNSFRVAGRAMAGPLATFAAAGAAFGAADCLMQDVLGRRDTLTGVVGGLAVGAVVGLKRGSLISGIGFGALCAGVMLVTDFVEKVAHPAFDDIKVYGPKEPKKAAA